MYKRMVAIEGEETGKNCNMKKNKHDFKRRIEDMGNEEIKRQQEKVKRLKMPEIRTIDFLYDEGGEVTYEYAELTALCPMTGIQDIYTVKITFVPEKKIPELKSLREYFLAYRDVPILHEHLANKIFKDFNGAVRANKIKIQLNVAIRGGITTTVVIEKG
ncbi:MAG: NADPH-dependent 7-cyano-7-deazaguanine reductase [bacterium]